MARRRRRPPQRQRRPSVGGFDPAAPFASVDDLEAAWRPLDDGERRRAGKLLGWAESRMRALLPPGWESDPGITSNLEMVAVESVRRQMSGPAIPATQMSQGAGGYTASVQLANPSGDWYLPGAEKDLLGIGGCVVVSVGRVGGCSTFA